MRATLQSGNRLFQPDLADYKISIADRGGVLVCYSPMKKISTIAGIALLTLSAYADTVLFKSGDRLSGTIKEVKDGKMLFTSKVAGALTLKMEDIQTFASDEPLAMILDDGTSVQQTATAVDGGGVEVVTENGQRRTLALEQIVKVNPEKVRWTGSAVASYMETAGNSVNRNATIIADAMRRSEDTRTKVDAGYFYSQQEADNGVKETTADNFFFGGKFDYFWAKHFYTYANARYYKDKILDLDHRLTTGIGLGYQWIETDNWNIFTELGAAYVDEKYATPGEKDSYLSARGAYHIERNFGERFSLFHNLEILESLDDTTSYLLTTDAGARAQITKRWFVEGRAMLLYNSEPPADLKKDDTRYTLGVGMKF